MLCELYIVSDSWPGIEYDEKVRCGLKRPRYITHYPTVCVDELRKTMKTLLRQLSSERGF